MARKESPAERRARRSEVDDPAVVLNAAARYLEARSRSISELRRHLVDGGYRSALVDGAVTRLTELGFLDDDAFARAWVASRDRSRPRGERALRLELVRKGIDEATIRTVMAERGAGPDDDLAIAPGADAPDGPARSADEAAAERLLARKDASLRRESDPRARRQKAYALLARNGFAPDVAARLSAAFARSLGEGPGEDDGPIED